MSQVTSTPTTLNAAYKKVQTLQKLQKQYFELNEMIWGGFLTPRQTSKVKCQVSYIRKRINAINL